MTKYRGTTVNTTFLELPEIVMPTQFVDLSLTPELKVNRRKTTDPNGGYSTAVTLSGTPFIVSEDARRIAMQLAQNFHRLTRKPCVAAMAFELFTDSSGDRMRLVLAMLLDGGDPITVVDRDWYTLPREMPLEELLDSFTPNELWTRLVEEASADPQEKIHRLITRAHRELDNRDRYWSHSHFSAAAYD